MKVLLLTPPYIEDFMRNARWDGIGISGSQWYPIHLAYCTALLERENHEPKLLDAQVDKLSHEETYREAKKFSPELTVIYFSIKSLANDLEVGARINELTGSDVVLVGHSASFNPVETVKMSSKIGMLATGEFDFTVLDLANRVPKENIKGLVWKDAQGKVHVNPPRAPVRAEELDKFPFVTDVYRRHLNIENYHQSCHWYPYVDLFTGRGCAWGKCSFCLWPNSINKGAGYRTRSIENVIEELQFVKEEMPYVKEVYIQDDVLPRKRAVELSEAILKNNLRIRWSGYSRANLDYETLKLMKKAGCRILEVGFESSNAEILNNIKKGTSKKGMEQFAKDAKKAGVFIIGAFITGLPGETLETIKESTEWAKRLPLLRYTYTLPKPYPGTPLYAWLEEHDCLNDGRPDYPQLSTEEIYKWNKWSLRQIYFSHNYFFRVMANPRRWLSVLRSVKYFLPYAFSKEKEEHLDLEW